MGRLLAVAACLLSLVLPAAALGDPADLDGSFATSGVTSVDFSAESYAEAVARQSSGKLIVVGAVSAGGNTWDWAVTRVGVDGGKDTTYGGGGTQEWPEAGNNTGAAAVAVEPDDEIDVVGDAIGKVELFKFGVDGTVAAHNSIAVASSSDVVGSAVALQPDGKIVVAGTARVSSRDKVFLARFNADGTPDTAFDNDGTADGVLFVNNADCDTGATPQCDGESLALVTSGGNVTAIYVGGEARDGSVGGRLLRFTPASGQDGFGPDTGYGTAGVVKLAPTALVTDGAMLLQPDGKVVLLGETSVGSTTQCGAVRLLGDGTVDAGFGSNGQVSFDGGAQSCSIGAAALGTDGRITFAGSRVSGSTPTQVLGRLTSTGQPDTTFAAGGFAVAPVGSFSFANGLVSAGGFRFVTVGGVNATHKVYAARYQGGERSTGGGGGATGGGGTTDTGTPPTPPAAPTSPPRPLTSISYRSNTDGSLLSRAGAGQAVACDPGTWSGDPGFSYAWFGVPRGGVLQPLGTSRVLFVDAGIAAKYGSLYCEVVGTNARGSKLGAATLLPTFTQIRMPDVAGLSVPEAKGKITDALGNVTFDKVTIKDGSAKRTIPCDFGGTKPDVDPKTHKESCDSKKKGKIHPGDVWATDPNGGRLLDVDGSPIKVSFSYYEPAKDADNDVDAADTKKWGDDCPLRTGKADDQRDLENRILGKPATEARATLTKLECPFEESIQRKRGIEAQDPYVESARVKSLDAGRGFVLDVIVPVFDDLAIAPYYVRLHGRDSFRGANLEKGPLNPGIGTDGKLTKTLGGQDNDVCFRIVEAATGRLVQGAVVTGVDPDGNPLGARDGIYLKPMRKSTDSGGSVCGSVDLHSTGSARIDVSYAGANGATEDGTLTIPVVDRKRDVWQTVDGRRVQCKGTCDQLGFASTAARAHAANVIDDIAHALKGIVDFITGAGRAQADLAGGDSSVSLYEARRRGGIEASFLALGGTLKPSLAPPGLISNDGGSLISNDGGSLISNDGGSVISTDGSSLISDKGAGIISEHGAGIISNDGASIVAQGAGNIVAQGAGNIISQDGGSRRAANGDVVILAATGGRVLAGAALGLTAERGGVVVQIGGRNVIFGPGGTLAPGTIIRTGIGNRIPTLPSGAIGLDPMVLARSVSG